MLFQLAHPVGVLGIAIALVIGVASHDAAQVLAAAALGDATARRSGRLKAGLAARLDVFGAVCAVILGYGWTAPVPMEERFLNRRKKVALAVAAGPAAYLAWCFACTALLPSLTGNAQLARGALLADYTFAAMFIVSLIPVPPLDGGRILLLLAPQSPGWQRARYQLVERNIGLAIALALLLLPLVIRFPSVVNNLAVDVLNPVGHAVAPSLAPGGGIGDVVAGLDVP